MQMHDVCIKIADNEALLEKCLEIRKQVFQIEKNIAEEIERDNLDKINSKCDHFLINYKNKPVGTVRICINNDKTITLQRFCFLSDYRKLGLGKTTLNFIEKYYKEKGIHKIKMDAKFEVCQFYQKCGYTVVSNKFIEAGIEHIKMEKVLK